tara:strand:+ start:1133 stop:1888 length:756 start_codon:yes stop_codon:yes gene_type:complete
MSSIYKKGRDGYYYYQTYIFNKKTGKKDKRIFHSLGTKDHKTALSKQKELDLSYASKKTKSIFLKYKYVSLVTMTTFLLVFFFTIRSNQNLKRVKTTNIESEISLKNYNTDSLYNKLNNKDSIMNLENLQKIALDPIKLDSNLKLPDYNIERVVELSSAFDQGKLYVTVNKDASNSELLLLCNEIKRNYKNFSNIIICIYNNTPEGKNIALGKTENSHQQDINKTWRVLYTFNEVEGAFFNDNPSRHLGVF